MMKIIVYKGFSKEFLNDLEINPLIESDIEDKIDIFKLNDDYEENLQLAILQNKNSDDKFWITYEEFTLNYDYFILMVSKKKIEINIINNNIYPEY